MAASDEIHSSPGNLLCKACGLCCTGHLFVWAKLRPSELDPAEALGMHVYRDDPTQRGFSQPCPLWQGACTIYDSPIYPHICRAYTCILFDEVRGENTTMSDALAAVEEAKRLIAEMKKILPASTNMNFRERVVTRLEQLDKSDHLTSADLALRQQADVLLAFFGRVFGVKDFLEQPGSMDFF